MCYFQAFEEADGYRCFEKKDCHGDIYYLRQPAGAGGGRQVERPPQDSSTAAITGEQLHRAYQEILDNLALSADHERDLLARGCEPGDLVGFRSLKMADRSRIARHLSTSYPHSWLGIPGLYLTEKGKPMLGGAEGLWFPCRDLQGRIQAVRIRSDAPKDPGQRYSWLSSKKHGGPSPGSPQSFWPAPDPLPDVVRLCEGEIKSFLAAKWTNVNTISGGAGIGSLGRRPILDWILELGANLVLLAPDADAKTNPHVAKDVIKVIGQLEAAAKCQGFKLLIESWTSA